MPILLSLAALLLSGGFIAERAGTLGQKAGIFAPDSQTNVPEAKGTIAQNVDKVGTAVSIGLLIVAGAFAYSLAKK